MKAPVVLVVCNALDDRTRLERGIHTDSPAASRKVFLMCRALRVAGIQAHVLSLGRGRASGKVEFHAGQVCIVHGVPTTYAPFSHLPGISHLLSLFGLLSTLRRFSRFPQRAVIFYNRMPFYLAALFCASRWGFRCVLDLEDGEIGPTSRHDGLESRWRRWLTRLFDERCRRALLACSALERVTSVRPVLSYYGTASLPPQTSARFSRTGLTCLMSGTVAAETGADLLVAVVRKLRDTRVEWAKRLTIEVTGKGPMLPDLHILASSDVAPAVRVHGRTTDLEYAHILNGIDVGLALKPVGGPLADTTFPSKVVEFAAAGMLVLTTDISDVRAVLGNDGAFFLTGNTADELVSQLERAVCRRAEAVAAARAGQQAVLARCNEAEAGRQLSRFILG